MKKQKKEEVFRFYRCELLSASRSKKKFRRPREGEVEHDLLLSVFFSVFFFSFDLRGAPVRGYWIGDVDWASPFPDEAAAGTRGRRGDLIVDASGEEEEACAVEKGDAAAGRERTFALPVARRAAAPPPRLATPLQTELPRARCMRERELLSEGAKVQKKGRRMDLRWGNTTKGCLRE